MNDHLSARRSIISSLASAVAVVALGSRAAGAQTLARRFQPARHNQDAWLDAVPGKHRTFIDASTVRGAGEAMLYANNLYMSNKAGYDLPERDIVVVVCLRHWATSFAFNDAMWAKYGKAMSSSLEVTDPKTKEAPTTNILYSVDYGMALTNLGATIESVVKRGTRFAVCEMAAHGAAGQIAMQTGGNPAAIYQELTANLIPNSRMVAAGVLAVNRAQEYGYTLLTAL